MDFDKWSFKKRKAFLKSLRHLTNDQIYNAFKKEGIEMHKAGHDDDLIGITPRGIYYYFALKPEKAKRTEYQNKMKQEYKHRYFLVVRD
jgi:septin family protein